MKTIDLEFIQSAEAAARGDRVRGASLMLWSTVFLFAALVVWANHATIDEVTKGQGKVIPSSSIQTIQNLEGGIVAEIPVTEGDTVSRGQILIVFDDTQTASSFREELARKEGLEAMLARLAAESRGSETIAFSDPLRENRTDLVERENTLFEKRRQELASRFAGLEKSRDLAREELKVLSPLVQRGLASKLEKIRLEREINDLTNELDELNGSFQQTAMEEYNKTLVELESLNEKLEARKDRVNRTVVRSPVAGTVNEVHIKTVGGVVQPGEPLLDIVPNDDTLLVEAQIRPSDIGFLHPGQKVVLKFTAYDFSIYGGLEGELEHISADTIADEITGEHFYQVRVRNEDGKLLKNGKELPLIPGMVAEVDVLTGQRTVFQYLTKPFHRMRYNALRER